MAHTRSYERSETNGNRATLSNSDDQSEDVVEAEAAVQVGPENNKTIITFKQFTTHPTQMNSRNGNSEQADEEKIGPEFGHHLVRC